MLKVCFLDIDGVLNTWPMRKEFGLDFISPRLVNNLKTIIDKTQAKIVLSSNWRIKKRDFDLAANALGRVGLQIFDTTKIPLYNEYRFGEISEWLRGSKDVDNFVVLDDIDMTEAFDTRMILCDDDEWNGGLNTAMTEKAIKVLTKG